MKCTRLVTPSSSGFRGTVLSYTSCRCGHTLTETAPLKSRVSHGPQATTVLTQDFGADRQAYKNNKGYLKRKIYVMSCRCLRELRGTWINNDRVRLVWRNDVAEWVPILSTHENFVANLAQTRKDWMTETLWSKKQQISNLLTEVWAFSFCINGCGSLRPPLKYRYESWLQTFQQTSGKRLPGTVSYIAAGRNYINIP